MRVKFVIITYPRTGSTYLCKVLNTCDGITCHSEIYHKEFSAFRRSIYSENLIKKHRNLIEKVTKKDEKVLKRIFKSRNEDPQSLLKLIYDINANCSIGFKIFPNQNDKILAHLLKDTSINKIILERKNRLRSYISNQIAIKSGRWDRYDYEVPTPMKVDIKIEKFVQYKQLIDRTINQWENQLNNTKQKYLKIYYEELIEKFPTRDIIRYLDNSLSGLRLIVNQKRQNPFLLKNMINNFSTVKSELKRLGMDEYLEGIK